MKTKKHLIYLISFLVVFAILLTIATIYDYQISEILASKGLQDGNYFSNSIFGRIFELIGEMPLYVFIMFACCTLISLFKEKNKKPLIICFYLIGSFASFYGLYKLGKYLAEMHPDTCYFLHHNIITMAIMVILGLALQFASVLLFNKYLKQYSKQLVPFAIIILFTAVCSQAVVQGSKFIFGRERFRAIYYLTYRNVESQGFTNWYVANGMPGSLAKKFEEGIGVSSSFFTSFPSGHTCAAGIVYSIIALPLCFDKLNNKKAKIILLVTSIFITAIVAFARIVMGAHYMSDVLVGGTITFAFAVLGCYLYSRYLKTKKIS